MFLNAEPVSTGTKCPASVPLRMTFFRSASVSGSSLRYFSSTSSSSALTVSSSLWRHWSASACWSAAISSSWYLAPLSSPSQMIAFILTRSTTPLKPPSVPIGSWMTAGVASRRLSIISTVRKKLAPVRSILLMKHMRGTLYLLAWRQTVSVCGSTPATESNTATAPSSTRSDRSTSMVKSTWPGVSMMLMRWSFQKAVVAADVMVMPRSCSWAMWSMTAAPSWTSPIL